VSACRTICCDDDPGPKPYWRSTLPKDPITNALKANFEAAHKAGERALKRRDFAGVAQAVERERKLIAQQRTRLEKTRASRRRHRKG
jgi:hypothetical protein